MATVQADAALGITRSQTVGAYSSKVSQMPNQIPRLQRNASNADILGRKQELAQGPQPGLLQRSLSLNTQDLSTTFEQSLRIDDQSQVMNQQHQMATQTFSAAPQYVMSQSPQLGPSSLDYHQNQTAQTMVNSIMTPMHYPMSPPSPGHFMPTPYTQYGQIPGSPMVYGVPPMDISGVNSMMYSPYPSQPFSPGFTAIPAPMGGGLNVFELPSPTFRYNNEDRLLSRQANKYSQQAPMASPLSHGPNRVGMNGMNRMDGMNGAYGNRNGGYYPEKTKSELMLDELRMKMKNGQPNAMSGRMMGGYHRHANSNQGGLSHGASYLDVGITWQLRDIKGFAYEFAKDQYGSRFIQHKLEDQTVPQSEKDELFSEISEFISPLCKDVFGNYVIQKLLEINVGTKEQHNYIYQNAVKGHMHDLSSHMYGCRVIQKLVEQVFGETSANYTQQNIGEPQPSSETDDIYCMQAQNDLLTELRPDVQQLVTDQNGNHVIQKCIEKIKPISRLDFFFESFKGQYIGMSKHPYGCRVAQRVLETKSLPVISQVISEILLDIQTLVLDQYANYVIQHIVEHQQHYQMFAASGGIGSLDQANKQFLDNIAQARMRLYTIVSNNVLIFSQHKFGSNVVECCIKFGSPLEKDMLVTKVLEGNNLVSMMKDQFANYVVQKVIDSSNQSQLERIVTVVQQNEITLRRLTYGKHIINKLKTHSFAN